MSKGSSAHVVVSRHEQLADPIASTIECGLMDCLRDRQVRYSSTIDTVRNWVQHRHWPYRLLALQDIATVFKSSDTLFLIGGGESINALSDSQWTHISKHDSFGINWWPVHPFAPTYYYTNYPRNSKFRRRLADTIQQRKREYRDTVFFVSRDRALPRGMHPRVMPEFFSESPTCCCYDYPMPIQIAPGESLSREHFNGGVYYRGALTLVLHLALRLGYRRIILVGVDLHDSAHFYDSYPECHWMVEEGYVPPIEERRQQINATVDSKEGTKIPIDQFLYSANELLFEPSGVELLVASPESRLADRIAMYDL